MIIVINPGIFETDDPKLLHSLSKLIKIAIDNKALWDINNCFDKLYQNEKPMLPHKLMYYFSEYDSENFDRYIKTLIQKSFHITTQQTFYLRTLKIGSNQDEITPELAIKIILSPTKIILENATNDWNFITSIIVKYKNDKSKKQVFNLLHEALINGKLEPENAGGKSQIIARFDQLKNTTYNEIHQYKLFCLFDSDKPDQNTIPPESKIILNSFIGNKPRSIDDIINAININETFHMFYKRELENYMPQEIITNFYSLKDEGFNNLTNQEYDFIDLEALLKPLKINSFKNTFSKLFMENFNKELLESRCNHHLIQSNLPNDTLEEISEIKVILQKLAKFI